MISKKKLVIIISIISRRVVPITNKIFYDAFEIGSVSVKWVRRYPDGESLHEIIRHDGNPLDKVSKIFHNNNCNDSANTIITGLSTKSFLTAPYRSEIECIERAIEYLRIKPDIVLSLGGESFTLYCIEKGIIKNILTSSKCAAGTGEFIVQQFHRMNMDLEQGLSSCSEGSKVHLATRCSVYCKSDATHKLNKGECYPQDIARSLISDLAVKVRKMVDLSRWSQNNILVTGGLSLNKPFIEDLKEEIPGAKILAVSESAYFEVFGASIISENETRSENFVRGDVRLADSKSHFERLEPVSKFENLLDYRVKDQVEENINPDDPYILGVDAGSTTTKAVLYNYNKGTIDSSCYLRTNGNPVEATRQCLIEIRRKTGDVKLNIIQSAATGSGRELVSVFLDNSLAFNEILAHARAAVEEVPDVETIFEIGGQDSKFISLLDGVPFDYTMNEGCSAGTGSFLEESALVDMNVPFSEISKLALGGESPIAFGERCAAFINTDLRNALQQGAHQNDVLAGLVYSIADNYISRVVGQRPIGDIIFFQGGVALNEAVSMAIASRTGKKVVVPSHPELMGCVGAALMALDMIKKGESEIRIFDLERTRTKTKGRETDMEVVGHFECGSCENKCEIKRIRIKEKIYPFGGLCSKFTTERNKNLKIEEGINLVDLRNKIMFDEFRSQDNSSPKGIIGIPLALTTYEFFPFYTKLITELGYNFILSEHKRDDLVQTLAPVCYPIEIVHSAVSDLKNRGVDYIFVPDLIENEISEGYMHSFTCPTTATVSSLIKSSFAEISDIILSPQFSFAQGFEKVNITNVINLGKKLKVSKEKSEKAYNTAYNYYIKYKGELSTRCHDIIKDFDNKPIILLAGRSYTICSKDVNLAIPKKITSKGYHVVPMDCFENLDRTTNIRNCWYYTQQILNVIQHAKKDPRMYICFLSCFSCGPDSCVFPEIIDELEGKTFCYLSIDSHTAHAGVETRIEAFLEIIEKQFKRNSV